jgi:predicted nucleic acid-binding protein
VGVLIDASVLIAVERGGLDLDALMRQEADLEIALASVTAAELLHGVHRAEGKRRALREAFVERLLEQLPVIAFDLVAARVHARAWAELARAGVSVGERDLLIAATAMAHGFAVATRDQRSFPRIPALSIVRWRTGQP